MTRHRIALIGRGGTGKTTLALALAQRLKLPIIQEQIRSVAKAMDIESISSLDFHSRNALQIAALQSQAWNERFLMANEHGFVSDRSVHDYFAYYHSLVTTGHPNGVAMETAYRRVATGAGKYSALFLIPAWSTETPDDGFRFSDPAFAQIESEIESALGKIPGAIRVQSFGVEDRVSEIVSHLRRIPAP